MARNNLETFMMNKINSTDKAKDPRRKLSYFGDKNDGRGTLCQKYTPLPAFQYITAPPFKIDRTITEEESKKKVFCKLKVNKHHNLERFLAIPERKNVWTGGIRSLCQGVFSAKTYKNEVDDRGVYTVIPEIDSSSIFLKRFKPFFPLKK